MRVDRRARLGCRCCWVLPNISPGSFNALFYCVVCHFCFSLEVTVVFAFLAELNKCFNIEALFSVTLGFIIIRV